MKKMLFICSTILIFFLSHSTVQNSYAQKLNFECKGSTGHCLETETVVYVGRAHATDNVLDTVIIKR